MDEVIEAALKLETGTSFLRRILDLIVEMAEFSPKLQSLGLPIHCSHFLSDRKMDICCYGMPNVENSPLDVLLASWSRPLCLVLTVPAGQVSNLDLREHVLDEAWRDRFRARYLAKAPAGATVTFEGIEKWKENADWFIATAESGSGRHY